MVCAAFAAGMAFAQAGKTLYMNGKPVSRGLITQSGKVYVPLAELAKGLDMVVVPKSDGYEIAPAGGANQVGDQIGKLGDTLSNGQFTFRILEVVRGAEYQRRFGSGTVTNRGGEVVAIICRAKNATDRTLRLNGYGGELSALTDTEEHAYRVDGTGTGLDVAPDGLNFLPGSAKEFALVFRVPASVTLKDLVYQLRSGGYVTGKFEFKKTVFRVAVPNGR